MYKDKSIEFIKNLIRNQSETDFVKILEHLKQDNRKGVHKIIELKIKEIEKFKMEENRILKMISFDKQFNKNIIAGIDEVGRGPLAGPVVAACVIMDFSKPILYINDSKKLSKSKREELYNKIIKNALFCSISEVDNLSIDKHNILNATFIAMNHSIEFVNSQLKKNNKKIDLILVDGNQKIKNQNIMQELVIKGDSQSYSIACASIIAKVYRDRLMENFHKIYPNYNFSSNSGYGTKDHIDAIKKYGLSKIHRKSFCSNFLLHET